MLFTAALVQAHWVTTDVWHELEPQSMASVLPVSPLLSVSALPLRSADLPSISQLEPSQLEEPGRVEAPGPANGQRLPEAGLRWKMSSQLDPSLARGEVMMILIRTIIEVIIISVSPEKDVTMPSMLMLLGFTNEDRLWDSCVLQHWFIPHQGLAPSRGRSHGPSS